jgi:hypothetical protein
LLRAANEKLHREHGLAAPGTPANQGGASFREAAEGYLVEALNAGASLCKKTRARAPTGGLFIDTFAKASFLVEHRSIPP